MAIEHKRIFISYAWENDAYRERVKSLAARLRQDGVDARLDAWHLEGVTIPEFMSREVRKAHKILILCSPQYRTKVHDMEDGLATTGSGWESMLVNTAIWTKHCKRNLIVGALFLGNWNDAAPDFLAGLPYIDLTDDSNFENNYSILLRDLTGQREQAPPLGVSRELAPIPARALRGSSEARFTLVSNVTIPKQLPAPPADFVGRKAETQRLVDAVKQNGVTVLGVRGIGGIGKTALALAVADTLAADYPVGQIYLDLKGAQHKGDIPGVRPLTRVEAMDHVIRSFNPTVTAAKTNAEREGFYRTILNGKRILLLMDNALNVQQVESLIPPAGCLMIVTAREHFTLPGIFVEDLPPLSRQDARQLLLKIAPKIGTHADELGRLCGYLPEALRTAASALASASNLDPAEFLARMNSARRRLNLTGVELSLATSAELLSDKLKERWYQLGAFPGTFDEFAASAVWRTSNVDGKNTLSSLLRSSLVEHDSKHNRYYLHDLVNDFVSSRCSQAALRLGQFRHSKYYADILAASDQLYKFSDGGVSVALELFDMEKANIESGQRWAADHMTETEDSAQLCLRYADASIKVTPLRLTNIQQTAWLTAGADSVKFLSRPRPGRRAVFESEVRILDALADAHLKRGELVKADGLLRRSFERREDLHAVMFGVADTSGFGDLLRVSGKKTKALKYHWECMSYIQIAKDFPLGVFPFRNQEDIIRAECRARGSLSDDFLALKRGEDAIDSFQEQLRLAETIGDRRMEMRASGRLGAAYKLLREYDHAIQVQKRSLTIAEELRDMEGQADAFFNLATTKYALGDRSSAIEFGQTASAVYGQIDSPLIYDVQSALQKWIGNFGKNAKNTKTRGSAKDTALLNAHSENRLAGPVR